jgi:hypothetical protein
LLQLSESGTTVVDTISTLGRYDEGLLDGIYAAGLSDDRMHPDDLGHLMVGCAIERMIHYLM